MKKNIVIKKLYTNKLFTLTFIQLLLLISLL